jgi:hypothetical protein
MLPTTSRQERERELRVLLTPAGYHQLQTLAAQCAVRQGKVNGLGESLVDFILACEQESGLITGR